MSELSSCGDEPAPAPDSLRHLEVKASSGWSKYLEYLFVCRNFSQDYCTKEEDHCVYSVYLGRSNSDEQCSGVFLGWVVFESSSRMGSIRETIRQYLHDTDTVVYWDFKTKVYVASDYLLTVLRRDRLLLISFTSS